MIRCVAASQGQQYESPLAFSSSCAQVSEGLRALNRVARVLRARRQEQGALSLASPEVRFEIDTETHDPLDVGVYQVCGWHMPASCITM